MSYLDDIDLGHPDLGDLYDELPLWSAPFGILLLDQAPLRRGMTVLDLGAGTGFLTMELAFRCGADAQIIAVDPWKAAATRLRRQLAYRGIGNVRVIEEDAATLDLPEASIDLIVSNLGLNNFENPAAVLGVCFRAAKPGARLLLTTNVVGHMREFYDIFRQTLVEVGLNDRLSALDLHIQRRGTVESINELLNRAGFENLGATTGSYRMRFADGSALLRHHFIRLAFVPGWKSIVPDALVETTFRALEENLNAVAARCGELAVAVPMVCIKACKSP
ncbi:MAG: class I SAM-dependent methyltransferase [Planctomycetales bacterium]